MGTANAKTVGLALSGGGARGYAHIGLCKSLVEKGLLPETFGQLKTPFYVSAANLNTARHAVLSSGGLADAVLASTSIPMVFNPVEIDGGHYVDGGLVKNLPASTIREKCGYLIGSHVNHMPGNFSLSKTAGLIGTAA